MEECLDTLDFGQTEVVNRSLGNILRSLVYKNPNQWDLALSQAEFFYDETPNRSTGMSPFQVFFRMHPRGVYELRDLSKQETRSAKAEEFAEQIQKLQEDVNQRVQKNTQKYNQRADMKRTEREFQVDDLVMVFMRKESFSSRDFQKTKNEKDRTM